MWVIWRPWRGPSTQAAAYLSKPLGEAEVFDALERVLGTSGLAALAALTSGQSAADARPRCEILLAEDNLVNQKLASRLLEKWGHRVTVAANGREVLEALRQRTFDLVLMDVQMPEMDGFETTAAIRKAENSTGRHLRIVAMTAHAMQGDRERCLAAGMDGYISKPFSPQELHAILSLLPVAETAIARE